MYNLKEKDILKVIISASEMNVNENGEIIPLSDDYEYRIDISFYLESKKESIIDISYSILETEVNFAEGYGRQIIKIDEI